MRLLHTKTFQFEEFFDKGIPEYAILSHRWGQEEVSFQGFDACREELVPRAGWVKIAKSCALAEQRGISWIWIDTCCIDKKSSAELSEAINSMFQWYQKSVECYAYLVDVHCVSGADAGQIAFAEEFRGSSWFTRGWTLQELLAPSKIRFYNSEWVFLGDKQDLASHVSIASGIRQPDLFNLSNASVAMRMNWASRRECTRVEDVAYSLLGIFNVNMPLLYGEGKKAFIRLQLEIVRKSDDESIFAWSKPKVDRSGLLADGPSAFAHSQDIIARPEWWVERAPYSFSNRGLVLEIPRFRCGGCVNNQPGNKANHNRELAVSSYERLIPLNCLREGRQGPAAAYVYLQKFGNVWSRVRCHELLFRNFERHNFSGNTIDRDPGISTGVIYIKQGGL